MNDGPGNGNVRPMRPVDYGRGQPVPLAPGQPGPATAPEPQPAAAAPAKPADPRRATGGFFPPGRPMRELLVGSVIGAAVLWAVPKALESLSARFPWPGRDDDEFDFEDEDFEP